MINSAATTKHNTANTPTTPAAKTTTTTTTTTTTKNIIADTYSWFMGPCGKNILYHTLQMAGVETTKLQICFVSVILLGPGLLMVSQVYLYMKYIPRTTYK